MAAGTLSTGLYRRILMIIYNQVPGRLYLNFIHQDTITTRFAKLNLPIRAADTLRNYYSTCDRLITPTDPRQSWNSPASGVRATWRDAYRVIAHIISDIRFASSSWRKIKAEKPNLRALYARSSWSLTMAVCLAYDHCFVIKYSNYLADMYARTELIIRVEYKINRASWCLFSLRMTLIVSFDDNSIALNWFRPCTQFVFSRRVHFK